MLDQWKYGDVEGECNSRLSIGDDEGDNNCTFRCNLAKDHEGNHKEITHDDKPDKDDASLICVEWVGDARVYFEKEEADRRLEEIIYDTRPDLRGCWIVINRETEEINECIPHDEEGTARAKSFWAKDSKIPEGCVLLLIAADGAR